MTTERQCINCDKWHSDTIVSTQTEEIIEEIKLCNDCLVELSQNLK